jgi:hypothetical protein
MHGRDGVTERYVAIGARILSYKEVPPSCSTDKCVVKVVQRCQFLIGQVPVETLK